MILPVHFEISIHDKNNTISIKLTNKKPATVEVIIVTSVRTTIPSANIRFRFRKGIRFEIICVTISCAGDQVGESKIKSQKNRSEIICVSRWRTVSGIYDYNGCLDR